MVNVIDAGFVPLPELLQLILQVEVLEEHLVVHSQRVSSIFLGYHPRRRVVGFDRVIDAGEVKARDLGRFDLTGAFLVAFMVFKGHALRL